MFGLGPWELGVILIIVIIIFGVGKLPEIGSGLGEGIKNFKKSIRDSKALDVTPDTADLDKSNLNSESDSSITANKSSKDPSN